MTLAIGRPIETEYGAATRAVVLLDLAIGQPRDDASPLANDPGSSRRRPRDTANSMTAARVQTFVEVSTLGRGDPPRVL